jgi:hypothetical protein
MVMNVEHAKQMLAHLETAQPEPLEIGSSVYHEIALRIRELRSRRNPAPRELREIARLEEFLRTVAPRDSLKVGFVLALVFAGFLASINVLSAIAQEPEHSFEGDGYDRAKEDVLLALDCDARMKPTIVGEARDVALKACVKFFRRKINANKWPQINAGKLPSEPAAK